MAAFEDKSFDLAIDKSLLDTFACGDDADRTIGAYLKEVKRILRPGGLLRCTDAGGGDDRVQVMGMAAISPAPPCGRRALHWDRHCLRLDLTVLELMLGPSLVDCWCLRCR